MNFLQDNNANFSGDVFGNYCTNMSVAALNEIMYLTTEKVC